MKKLLTIIAVLLIAFALIAPKFAGDTFNENLDNFVAAINENGVYTAQIEEREQSWFNTNASLTIGIKFPQMPQAPAESALEDIQAKLALNAQHGPILTQNGFAIGWLDWAVVLVSDELPEGFTLDEEGPLYEASGTMGLAGVSSYVDSLKAISFQSVQSEMSFSSTGWQGEGYFGSDLSFYQGQSQSVEMSMPGIYEFGMSDVSLIVDADASWASMMRGQLYNGAAEFIIESLTIKNALDGSQIELESFFVESASALNDAEELADIDMNMGIKKLSTPEMTLSQLLMNVEINNIEQAFMNAYQQMNKAVMETPEKAVEIMQQAMENNLLSQLQAEPEFNISNFSAVLNEGSIEMQSVNKVSGVTSLPDTMEDNGFWLKHASSDTSMNIEKSAALFIAKQVLEAQLAGNPQLAEMDEAQLEQVMEQQSVATLNGLVQQGLIIESPEGYSMSFTLNDGKALLNGNAIPLPM